MAEMHAWVQCAVGELFHNRDGRLLGFEAALVQARKDGVHRLEIGEDVWAITLYNASAYGLTRGPHRRVQALKFQPERCIAGL